MNLTAYLDCNNHFEIFFINKPNEIKISSYNLFIPSCKLFIQMQLVSLPNFLYKYSD